MGFKLGEWMICVGSYSPDSQGSGVSDFAIVNLLSSLKKGILLKSIYRGSFKC